ncbi:DUF58 domain-containing protein [Dactylosporangium sp. NPDC050688]|uniref:DUF58 domain-containing protein n=1 Tax=Dactylosporangium sp. NPDC050688 TaxID=3157217 RepID=UPI0033F52FF7
MASAPDRLLRRLEWQVLRRLDGQLQGAYRTVFRGAGIDFADLREYTHEDDVRHIDWNVTARLDEPYVRQYTEDRELTAWLVLDLSASMRFGAGQTGRGKDGLLTELAVCLARLFTQGGNRIGAVLYDNGLQRVVPPRTGRTHVLRLAHEIGKATEAAAALRGKPGGAATDVDGMLRLAAAQARRRGLIFVISDFLSGDTVNWEDSLLRLTHRHEVVAIRIVDPMELDLPDLGLVLVEDAETGEQVLVDTSDPLFQQRLREEVDGREAAVAGAMRRSRVAAHRVSTDEDPLLALVEMVRWSKRRRA